MVRWLDSREDYIILEMCPPDLMLFTFLVLFCLSSLLNGIENLYHSYVMSFPNVVFDLHYLVVLSIL